MHRLIIFFLIPGVIYLHEPKKGYAIVGQYKFSTSYNLLKLYSSIFNWADAINLEIIKCLAAPAFPRDNPTSV